MVLDWLRRRADKRYYEAEKKAEIATAASRLSNAMQKAAQNAPITREELNAKLDRGEL